MKFLKIIYTPKLAQHLANGLDDFGDVEIEEDLRKIYAKIAEKYGRKHLRVELEVILWEG